MQVLLLKNVKGVGLEGEVKNVKDGYFKNYLLPNGLAVLATSSVIKQVENIRKDQTIQKERLVGEANDVVKKIDGVKLNIVAKNKEGKLYGSILEKDVISALEKEKKVKLEKNHLVGFEPIKNVGVFDIKVKIIDGAEAVLKLEILGE